MPTKVITLANKTLTSSYNAYNDAFGNTSLDTPSLAYYGNTTIDLLAQGIPAGSTITGVVMYALYSSSLHGYSLRDCSINGTNAHTGTWASGNTTLNHALITGTSFVFNMRFKSSTMNTNYPPPSGDPYDYTTKLNSSSVTYSSISLSITYTEPYSACSAPTTVTTPTDVAPGSDYTLSFAGAGAGTNNAITGYQVYRSTTAGSGYTALGSKIVTTATSGSLVVTSHATNGSMYYYKVITLGTVAGFDSGLSSAYATLKTTVTDPTAPTALSTPNHVAPSSTHNLTWSGAGAGTNNAISTYEIHRSTNGGTSYSLLATDSASPLAVTAPASNGATYLYKIKTIGARSSSGLSTATASLTTTVGAPGVPTAVSVASGFEVAPGKTRTLSWSGASAGTNNPIKGYQVYRSVNGGAYAFLAEVLTTATSASLSVSAATAAATYTYKVLVLGSTLGVNSALSSAYGTLKTVTTPSTGTLTVANIVATGTSKIGITLTAQPETSYTHKVTWFIPGTSYTSGEVALIAGDLYDEYMLPQTWINATTKATTSVTASCKVETFNASTSIGANTYTFVVSVPPKSTFTLAKGQVTANGADTNTATISPSYSGYSHKITWSTSGYSSGTLALSAGTNTHAYAVPLSWNNAAPSAVSFSVSCVVETIKTTADGSLSLGSNTRTFTAAVPANILPTISAFTASQVSAYWSLYVKTKSKCKLALTAAGASASTITSFRITGATQDSGALTYAAGASWTTSTLMVHGTVHFTVTVTDSRGRTASQSLNITVTDYSPPSISAVTFTRATATGLVSNTGTYINAKATLTFSAIGSNAITALAYYRQSGTTAWLPAAGTALASNTTLTYGAGAINQAYIYETRITLSDYFTTVEHLGAVPKAVKVFDLREDRAAFGAFATNAKELYVPSDWKLMVGTASAFTTAHTIPLANGGTGATTAAAARTALGVAATVHTHTKAQITDFPASLPASDVYAWAKASVKPSYTHTEVGAAAASHSHSYLPLAGGTLTGKVAVPTATRSAGIYGAYDSTKIGHVWSMGTAYSILDDGTTFGTLYGIAYKHTNNTTGGTMAGGHQIVFCNNGTPGAAIGLAGNIWTSGTVTAGTFSGPLTGNVTGNCSGSSGSCTGNAATATTASNSNALGGLPLGSATQGSHPGANVVVRTDANGYINCGWINTVSGSASGTPTRIYCSQDAYLRYYAPSNATLRRSLGAYITAGTAAPSGGVAGDIYIQYV